MNNLLPSDTIIGAGLCRSGASAWPLSRQRELLARLWMIAKGNGPGGLLLMLFRTVILPPCATLQSWSAAFYRPCLHIFRRFSVGREMALWQSRREKILQTGKKGYRSTIDDLGLPAEEHRKLQWLAQTGEWVKVADIDQDGFFLSYFGALTTGPCIHWQDYQPRRKHRLSLVASRDVLGVRKEFRGNRIKFLNELKTLHNLAQAGCRVPAILDVDFANLDIVVSFIKGKVLRQELADRGAAILDRQVEADPQLRALSAKDIRHVRIKRALKVLPQAVDARFIEALFAELRKIHQSGIVVTDVKYGNIIIEKNSGEPYLIDFENAFSYPWPQGAFFGFLSDLDRELFNVHFGTDKVTYRRLRKAIASRNLPSRDKWYAPLYIGSGLKIGRIWDIDVGSGRWRYILRNQLPDVTGKRILDLGANNAFNGIHMLRHGAAEVIGIELDSEHIEQGRLVKEIYEWADNRSYNFHYFQANMADIPYLNLGEFDFVTAFCCIYYLDDEAIGQLLCYLGTITGMVVLQCNHHGNVGRRNVRTYEKARLEYAVTALKNNGFTQCSVVAPSGYKRPLVIGRRV